MTRRDLMKYFGVGAIITPVAGEAIQARLIEIPKVELVKPEPIQEGFCFKPLHIGSISVQLHLLDGTTLEAETHAWQVVDVTSLDTEGHWRTEANYETVAYFHGTNLKRIAGPNK